MTVSRQVFCAEFQGRACQSCNRCFPWDDGSKVNKVSLESKVFWHSVGKMMLHFWNIFVYVILSTIYGKPTRHLQDRAKGELSFQDGQSWKSHCYLQAKRQR